MIVCKFKGDEGPIVRRRGELKYPTGGTPSPCRETLGNFIRGSGEGARGAREPSTSDLDLKLPLILERERNQEIGREKTTVPERQTESKPLVHSTINSAVGVYEEDGRQPKRLNGTLEGKGGTFNHSLGNRSPRVGRRN